MYNIVTPWPPQPNGIADYALEVAASSASPVTVVTRAINPFRLPNGTPIISDFHEQAAAQLAHGRNIFHFGNNTDHVFAIPLFLRHGGTAVIHDTTLHFLAECADATMPGFFAACLRQEQPQIADQLMRQWRNPDCKRLMEYQELKLLTWLGSARAIVVHSNYAARVIGARLPGVPVHVVPHFAYQSGIEPHARHNERLAARNRLALDPETFVIATLGFVTANKQNEAIIRAVMRLPPALRARTLIIIAGQIRPQEYDPTPAIARLRAAAHVRHTGFATPATLRDVLLAADLVCNLRYPTFGESSGILARALGLGCATVVSDTGSYAELPQNICLRVPAKPDPSRELATLFGTLMEHSTQLNPIREAAEQYALDLSPAHAARRYEEIVHG